MNKKLLIIILTLLFLITVSNVFAQSITTFSSGNTEENIGFPPASSEVGVTISDNAMITYAKMDVSGLDTMGGLLDIVFVVDISGSMDAEWIALCATVGNIVSDLQSRGIDTQSKIYALSSNRLCSEDVIQDADLDAAADAAVGFNVDLEDNLGYQESWMAGIIWVSDPANGSGTTHTWRNPTTKVIIPISDETDDIHKSVLSSAAITAAINNNVIVYGLWGDSLGDGDVDNYMMDISAQTQGVSCLSDPYVDPIAPETWKTKCPNVGATSLVNGPALVGLIEQIIVAYISDISIDIGNNGSIEWSWPGELRINNSPQTFYFNNALNDYYTAVCNSASCNIPISVFSSASPLEGILRLHNLVINTAPIPYGGLIPCGRKYDDPNTNNVNETDECTICHFFLMIKNILDFVMKLAVIVAILFIAFGGLLYIFSTGREDLLIKAKGMILWALAGFVLIFAAWIFIALILSVFGYTDPLGGQWDVIC